MSIGMPLADVEETLSVLMYGEPGTGKTSGALSLANIGRVLLINAEGGAKKTPLKALGVNVDNIDTWPNEKQGPGHITYQTIEDEVYLPMRAAAEAGKLEHVGLVIDSFSELSRRLLDDVIVTATERAARLGKAREPFQTDLADHGVSSQMMRTLLRRFRDLGIHLVITALERRDVDSNGAVVYGPAVGPAIANDTMGLVDVVCYTKVQDLGGQKFYLGVTTPAELRKAKDRFGVLPGQMVDPTAERMLGYLLGDLTKATDPRQAAARNAVTPPAATPTAEATDQTQETS